MNSPEDHGFLPSFRYRPAQRTNDESESGPGRDEPAQDSEIPFCRAVDKNEKLLQALERNREADRVHQCKYDQLRPVW
jgi:hypothetical protein